MTLKVFRAGNSNVVTIPDELAQKYGMGLGVRLIPEMRTEGILYRVAREKKPKISKEFDTWLKKTSKKYAPALRALAKA